MYDIHNLVVFSGTQKIDKKKWCENLKLSWVLNKPNLLQFVLSVTTTMQFFNHSDTFVFDGSLKGKLLNDSLVG